MSAPRGGPSVEKDAPCPRCGSDAYHGVITEPDEPERWACDQCGHVEESLLEPIHTPCGLDWTNERGDHVCRFNMDHRGEHACSCLECRITRDLPPEGSAL